MLVHPARAMPFADLCAKLDDARGARLVSEQRSRDGLSLYCYTNSAVYDRAWTPATLIARGLILDRYCGRVVATPFPKFFNVGERGEPIPDLAFETFEKVDGSLIIIFHHDGRWRTATKGSFVSPQAEWAARYLTGFGCSALDPAVTYLAEAIYPDNRIVVHYHETGLVLLAAYDADGVEVPYADLLQVGAAGGWRVARRYAFDSVSDLIARAGALPISEEGFVIRFANGLRLKLKGEEYRRIHALISRVTPLAVWEMMQAGDDLTAVRRDLPEEFWGDFDLIVNLIKGKLGLLVGATRTQADLLAGLSDKEVGLRLSEFAPDVRSFIFPYRKNDGDLLSGKTRQALFRAIRPDANRLDGYIPSYAMNRIMEEAA